MTDEEAPRPLSETQLCVRYRGNSNFRILTLSDLRGEEVTDDAEELVWTPGSEIAWATWLDYAGSDDRAHEVLKANADDFDLVGPGAHEIEVEEFSIEAS